MRRMLDRLKQREGGFTLIEMLVALTITSIIGMGATMATVQIINQGTRNSDYTTASRNTMNALYWMSRDAQMAQVVTLSGGSGFPLTLDWTEWDNTEHEVTYTFSGDELRRTHTVDGDVLNQMLVAQYLEPAETTCVYATGNLTLRVTATLGEGLNAVTVSKVRGVAPRPGL
ncbi:MAG: prepilin-type N-terminal cleavage/methylation domain-containing protein [Chloroflexota bacterium]